MPRMRGPAADPRGRRRRRAADARSRRGVLLDHEHVLKPVRESPRAFFVERPDHADFVHANAEAAAARPSWMPRSRSACRTSQIALAGGGDAEAGAWGCQARCGRTVCARERHGGGKPEMAVHLFLLRRGEAEAAVASSGRFRDIHRNDRCGSDWVDPDGCAGVHDVGNAP